MHYAIQWAIRQHTKGTTFHVVFQSYLLDLFAKDTACTRGKTHARLDPDATDTAIDLVYVNTKAISNAII